MDPPCLASSVGRRCLARPDPSSFQLPLPILLLFFEASCLVCIVPWKYTARALSRDLKCRITRGETPTLILIQLHRLSTPSRALPQTPLGRPRHQLQSNNLHSSNSNNLSSSSSTTKLSSLSSTSRSNRCPPSTSSRPSNTNRCPLCTNSFKLPSTNNNPSSSTTSSHPRPRHPKQHFLAGINSPPKL